MWTRLANWLVQDGEVPELTVGDILHQVALGAECWSLRESPEPEGITEGAGPDPAGEESPHFQVTGIVDWGREPGTALLRVGGIHVLAEPNTLRQVPGTSERDYALEPYSPDFRVPAVGTHATVTCRLRVLPDYETEIDFPMLHRDWTVRAIKIEHRALVPIPGRERERTTGRILRVDDVQRMRRWADDADRDRHITYLLDLWSEREPGSDTTP